MTSNQRTARSSDLKSPHPSPSHARRPATLGASSAALKSGSSLKSRPSLSSLTEWREASLEDLQDNMKAAMNGPTKRTPASRTARSTSPTKASLGRRSVLASTTNIEKKPASDRPSTASPLKSAMKGITSTPRPSKPTVTPRSTRPIGYSPQSTTTTKKPSSNSANHESPSLASSKDQQTATVTKFQRPQLLARKSTMSMTIEQRLREMEVVNIMLRAAMAEDGEEDDEVKEEYGRKADEDLANLRLKLEEARRSEGKEALKVEAGAHELEADSVQPSNDNNALAERLAQSQQQTSTLQSEIASLREQLAARKPDTTDDIQTSIIAGASNDHQEDLASGLKADLAHMQTVASLQRMVEEAEAALQNNMETHAKELTEAKRVAAAEGNKRATHLLDNQLQHHQVEISSLQDVLTKERQLRLDATAQAEQLGYELLDLKNEADENREKLEISQKELTQQKLARNDADATCEELTHELINAERALEAERTHHQKVLKQQLDQQRAEHSSEIENIIFSKDSHYKQVIHELHVSQVHKDQLAASTSRAQATTFAEQLRAAMTKIQNLETISDAQLREFNKHHAAWAHRIQELKSGAETTSANLQGLIQLRNAEIQELKTETEKTSANWKVVVQRKDAEIGELSTDLDATIRRKDMEFAESLAAWDAKVQSKADEITKWRAVVDSLQTRVRDVHEAKDREIDSLKWSLSQEYEEKISHLHKKHHEALFNQQAKHDQDFEAVESTLREAKEVIDTLTDSLNQSQTDLKVAKESNDKLTGISQEQSAALHKLEEDHNLTRKLLEQKDGKLKTAASLIDIQNSADEELRSDFKKRIDLLESTAIQVKSDGESKINEVRFQYEEDLHGIEDELLRAKARIDGQANALTKAHTEIEVLRHMADSPRYQYVNLEEEVKQAKDLAEERAERLREAEIALGEFWEASAKNELPEALNIDALKYDNEIQRKQNASLQQQLRETVNVAEQRALQLRASDAATKVIKAELLELQTKTQVNGSRPSTPYKPPSVLSMRLSPRVRNENSPSRVQDMGPSILGNLASMKEQIKQLENMNEDAILDQDRFLKRLDTPNVHTPFLGSDSKNDILE